MGLKFLSVSARSRLRNKFPFLELMIPLLDGHDTHGSERISYEVVPVPEALMRSWSCRFWSTEVPLVVSHQYYLVNQAGEFSELRVNPLVLSPTRIADQLVGTQAGPEAKEVMRQARAKEQFFLRTLKQVEDYDQRRQVFLTFLDECKQNALEERADLFGTVIARVEGEYPYLVHSSLHQWPWEEYEDEMEVMRFLRIYTPPPETTFQELAGSAIRNLATAAVA